MKTITLGREGNQPFKIDAEGVSRIHAKITIDDDEEWQLEDLDSANGTYVRDETDGNLKRIVKNSITPMTFICLGPDNAKGCSFYARQALKENYGHFTTEYEFLNEKEDLFDKEQELIELTSKRLNLLKTALPFLLFGLSIVLIPGEGTIQMLIRMAASTVPSVFIQVLYNPLDKIKKLKEKYESVSHCPNPHCSNKLRSNDIRNMKCPKCKK